MPDTYKIGDTAELILTLAKASIDTRHGVQHSVQDSMPAYATLPYRNATKLSNHLMTLILKSEDEKGAALLMREWRETEQVKREWRGLPRLSPASMKELLDYKRANMKQLDSNVTIREVDETIDHPVTVPTPPEGGTPSACTVVNDK